MEKDFNGSMESRTMMKLNNNQVCIINDDDDNPKQLGTGFHFLKEEWIFTAAHVVMIEGYPRENIFCEFFEQGSKVNVKVLAIHAESDLAILEIIDENNPCTMPLFPGNEDLSTSRGIIYCGYDSSTGGFRIEHTSSFKRSSRIRNHEEIILEFSSDHVTGGFSGGPIFGDGGSVIGVMINQYSDETKPNKSFARAVSIKTFMEGIEINIDKQKIIYAEHKSPPQ